MSKVIDKDDVRNVIRTKMLEAIENIGIETQNNNELIKLLSKRKISNKEFDKKVKELDKSVNYFRGYIAACKDVYVALGEIL